MKIAYVFALVGSPSLHNTLVHLTAIELFQRTAPQFEVVSMQTSNMKRDRFLEDELRRMKVRRVYVQHDQTWIEGGVLRVQDVV